MEYTVRFRLDVKNNVYVSKKDAGKEPFYQISAIIRINRGREIHYSLGYSAQKSSWFATAAEANKGDGNRGCGIHRNHTAKHKTRIVQYAEVNRAIDLIAGKLSSLANKVDDITKEELIEVLDAELGKSPKKEKEQINAPEAPAEETISLWALADLYCIDHIVTEGRRKTRSNSMSHFKTFEANRGKEITFADCSVQLLTAFHKYLKEDDGSGEIYKHIKSAVHRPRQKNRNTISKILTTVKHFLNWSRKQYGITDIGNIRDYQVPTAEYGDPITLTLEEKRKLFDYEFPGEELEFTRDLFYFQCSIGCRVSDFFSLKYENLQSDGGMSCIKYLPKKTKEVTVTPCRIPLSEKALVILNRYKDENADPKAPLFQFPKNPQTYNNNLKKMFKEAGLNRLVTVSNADGTVKFVPFYEIAKSKFARSCFIDVLVGQGMTDNIIATMSGHKAGSNAFHRYHNSDKVGQQNIAATLLD